MNTLIIYDSLFGNTEKIAQTIKSVFIGNVEIRKVTEVNPEGLKHLDFLVIGSPTQGGRPTLALQNFIKKIPAFSLRGVKVASFDTRFDQNEHGLGLKILMNIIHFAAGKIANGLVKKGGTLIVEPEGFIVEDKKGPLKSGEIARAIAWGKSIYLN